MQVIMADNETRVGRVVVELGGGEWRKLMGDRPAHGRYDLPPTIEHAEHLAARLQDIINMRGRVAMLLEQIDSVLEEAVKYRAAMKGEKIPAPEGGEVESIA